MAVTITRSIWIDDDGSGSTGTVINQALHTTLYNEIDTALAKVAQLAGGNTFTGNQVVNAGSLSINTSGVGAGMIAISADSGAGRTGLAIQSSNVANNLTYLFLLNSALGTAGTISQIGATSVAYNTTSDARLKDDAGRAIDVSALRAVVVHDFTWKADGRRARGVFAQEAHAVCPHAITVGTDEMTVAGSLARPWMTDYSKFVPDLIVGWQQHDAALAELRALLATVTG